MLIQKNARNDYLLTHNSITQYIVFTPSAQIRILTSGTSEIVKLTEESAKYKLMKTGMSQYVIINCQEIFVSNTRHLQIII